MIAVYKAIAAVAGELAREGISKDRKNSQQGYNFRGIDDVLNALSPLLVKHGLLILPRCMERECVERQTKSGGTLFYSTVKAEFDFVSVEDGSKHTVATYGEAMDSADKSTNKAMSAAYKYAAFQAFAIPTEGDNDADATTHDVAPTQRTTQPAKTAARAKPAGMDDPLKKIAAAATPDHLYELWTGNATEWKKRPDFDALEAAKNKRKAELGVQ